MFLNHIIIALLRKPREIFYLNPRELLKIEKYIWISYEYKTNTPQLVSSTTLNLKIIMDSIMNNTEKYAKYSVVKDVQNPENANMLKVKEIFVVDKAPTDPSAWRAILVDSYTQAGKTKKCFEILSDKMQKEKAGNTLVMFITQANSLASTTQTIQRAKASELINSVIPASNIFRSGNIPTDGLLEGNYMMVDFWNARNMGNMLNFVRENKDMFSSIIVIVDECEQGHVKGLKERLSFIRKVETSAPDSIVKVIFITATVANLSKSILQVAKANEFKFKTGVVSEIINKAVVEHQFAEPHSSYVGASWFKETPGVWKRLLFPKKSADISKNEYAIIKEETVMEEVKALPKAAKELTLFVTSTRTCDHKTLAERLYRSEYNVTVEMNGTNSKNFKVKYVNKSGGISSWDIPFSQIDAKADSGDLATFWSSDELVDSDIRHKDDYSMSHMLQAALFMKTDAKNRIKKNVVVEEYNKLEAISNAIMNLDKSLRRPDDYPKQPRVALIAGHLAGRGITFQNAHVDFTCTSFCFTDTRDAVQCGATNTQRFGRACGMLMDVFAKDDRKPILIATDGIMKDALANEAALKKKAGEIENGTLFSFKDMITKDEWESIIKKTKDAMNADSSNNKGKKAKGGNVIDGVIVEDLIRYFKSDKLLVGKMIRFLYQMDKPVTFEEFKAGIMYDKSDKQFQNNIDNGRGVDCVYGKFWCNENSMVQINPNIKTYLDTIA